MLLLILNSGSSSLKFQVVESKDFKPLYKGHVDGIGLKGCIYNESYVYKGSFRESSKKICCKDHELALQFGLEHLQKTGIVKDLEEISAIGHRVVHGGEFFKNPVLATPKVISLLWKFTPLAPLHNPSNIAGISASMKLLKDRPNILVFDTAFHQTIPEKAYLYAVPFDYYEKYKIRRYGFHGTSHQYVSKEAVKYLKRQKLPKDKIISCHLGNGCSITAIQKGKSIDTSMGFTPLEGVPMGTRSGDIDPALVEYLGKKLNKNFPDMVDLLIHESGLKGLSAISSDVRVLRDKWFQKKNKDAKRALDVFCYRIAKYIGAYTTALQGLDCLIFTGGIGEKAWYIRQWICDYFVFLGAQLDDKKNKLNEFAINLKNSKVQVLVIPTNEERLIAMECMNILK